MSKKKKETFIVAVFFKIKAEDYSRAEDIATQTISSGIMSDQFPNKAIKNWSVGAGDLQS